MKFYPESALQQLEFEKIKELLISHTTSAESAEKCKNIRLHTRLPYIQTQLQQTENFVHILTHGGYFPLNQVPVVQKELRLLGIPNSILIGEQWLQILRLCTVAKDIFQWFTSERREAYATLNFVLQDSYYEKTIAEEIKRVLDDYGVVMDSASDELYKIRMSLQKKRNELRRMFDRIVGKLAKEGFITEINESFLNNRRVVAIFAENKRQVKGILHGESETRRTAFVEPEETIELNNEIFSLENDERREVAKILQALTAMLSSYAPLLKNYLDICIAFDFIRAKAKLAIEMNASMPQVVDKSVLHLQKAYHPLLFLYNKKNGKPTVPLAVDMHDGQRIIVISGPNAGGKTVAMKTIGLLQLMLQSGLLVPVDSASTMGIFKQLFIHIGDTQSLEFELSTYSSHLMHVKHFLENANGRTLFFIDELGGGSDPNLGGAFAEATLEELAKRHSLGIVTTHYLNLKILADKNDAMVNASMRFDEENLQPLYSLQIGKPGSSYTFSIAEKIGLEKKVIERAKSLVQKDQVVLDSLLNTAEQGANQIEADKAEMKLLLLEQDRMNAELKVKLNKEKHRQEMERLKLQNKMTDDKLNELKILEKKIKQAVFEWKNSKNKSEAISSMETLLFYKKAKNQQEAADKKFNQKYTIIGGELKLGALVRMKSTNQVSILKEFVGNNKATIQLGLLPANVDINDLEMVVEKEVKKI
jgi:DNA mismatch repair protein MutS2